MKKQPADAELASVSPNQHDFPHRSAAGRSPVAAGAANRLAEAARRWRIAIVTVLVTTLLAWIFAVLQPKRWSAEAVVAVAPVTAGMAPEEIIRSVDTLERRTLVATVAALASTRAVHETSVRRSAGAEDYIIEATVLPNTNLIRIEVEGPDRLRVVDAANRIAPLLSTQAQAMYGVYRVIAVTNAVPPEEALYPRVERIVLAGLLVGVLLGVVLSWGVERQTAGRER